MRFSANRWNRRLERLGHWLFPEEARALARHQRMKAFAAAAALLLYADGSQACSTVPADSVTSGVIHQRTIDEVALDRSASVVHASFRRLSRAPRPDAPLPSTGPDLPVPLREIPQKVSPVADPVVPTAFAPPVTPFRAITQGEFASLMATTLRLRPPRGGWSAAEASKALSALRLQPDRPAGVLPPGGWRLDRPLTEGDLAFLLSHLGLQVTTREPERPISAQEADLVMARLASLFRALSPASYSDTTTAWRDLRLGNPRAPLSASTP